MFCGKIFTGPQATVTDTESLTEEQRLTRRMERLLAAYHAAGGDPPSFVLRRILGSNSFMARVRSGSGFNVRSYDRIVIWIRRNWPEGAEWPEDIPVPPDDAPLLPVHRKPSRSPSRAPHPRRAAVSG